MKRNSKEITHLDLYDEKRARAEGWAIQADDAGQLQLCSLTGPDEEAHTHVIAKAWAGSGNHRAALDCLERLAPATFETLGVDALKTASVVYRKAEQDRFREVEAEIKNRCDADQEMAGGARRMFNTILQELQDRRIENGVAAKSFEVHHESEVVRQALFVALHDLGDVSAAGDQVRRRIQLTATPTEFFGPQLDQTPEPEDEGVPSL